MEDMDINMNVGFYGVNMGGYGVGSSSMSAMRREEEQPASDESMTSSMTMTMTIPRPPTTSSLAAAAAMFHSGGYHHNHHDHVKHLVGGHFSSQQLVMTEQAAVISDPSLSSVKTTACSNHFEFQGKHQNGGRSCCPEPSLIARAQSSHSQFQQQQLEAGSRMATSFSTNPNDSIDAMRTKIAGHPHYPRLLAAYMQCHKIGAPPEVVVALDEIMEKQYGRHSPTTSIGADPELDQFMEAYCKVLGKYQVELTRPYKEALEFIDNIETQLNSLSIGAIRNCPSGYPDGGGGGGSSEHEFGCGEIELHEVDPVTEDKELKDQLLRKYSGYFSSLRKEFLKKKKKGKLPIHARQKLLDWWNLHNKWPYPSETDKVVLAESTGLDQKQINNWFINQRKRHWKTSEDAQFMVMDPFNPHTVSFFIDAAEG